MEKKDVIELFGTDMLIVTTEGARISADKFADLFSEANSNPTYSELIEIEEKHSYGYKKFLNECKEKGILK